MNVIAKLGFELAYNNLAVQYINHYTREIPLCKLFSREKYIYINNMKTDFIRLWKIFLYDCFIFWKYLWGNINDLYNLLQGLHPKIKYTIEYNFRELRFSDIPIKNQKGRITTDIYRKPTDTCDVVCYREREGEVNSLTLLCLNQQALRLTVKIGRRKKGQAICTLCLLVCWRKEV